MPLAMLGSPGSHVTQHWCTGCTSGMAGHAGCVVNLFTGARASAGRCRRAATAAVACQAALTHWLDTLLYFSALGFGEIYRQGANTQAQGQNTKNYSSYHNAVLY